MRTNGLYIAVALLIIGCQQQQPSGRELDLSSENAKAGYAIGCDIGRSFKAQGATVDPDAMAQGIIDVMNDNELAMTDEDMQSAIAALQTSMQNRQGSEMSEQGESNKAEGAKFLAENKTKEGVVELPSGLQYKVIKEGSGKSPGPTDTVVTHYKGTLINGEKFDSSYDRGQPATFPVNGVIKGWTEALQLMKEGSKWELYVPGDLAYGARGAGGKIGPNATLIFEVEVIEVKE